MLVPKKDETYHFYVDFRRNAITKKNVYPLPHIDDTLDTESKFFLSLDLVSSYWQVELDPEISLYYVLWPLLTRAHAIRKPGIVAFPAKPYQLARIHELPDEIC